ncbi:MAG: hypothetical protein M3227_00970 [Thermoproteota archaeon]|nr:hypothetical protein [Thermoproteota archaeon]
MVEIYHDYNLASLAESIAMISIMICSIMALVSQEQLSFAKKSANNPTQLENGVKEMNNKAVVIAFTEAFNNRNSNALDNLVAHNVTEHRPGIQYNLVLIHTNNF